CSIGRSFRTLDKNGRHLCGCRPNFTAVCLCRSQEKLGTVPRFSRSPGESPPGGRLVGGIGRQEYYASLFKSTRSRSSLPALKCGTCLAGTLTFSPDFGLRPTRGGL